MKKLIIIGALLLGLVLPGLAQDVVTPGMSGLQTRNALNTAFSEMLGVVDTVNETIRIGGVQITANAAEVNILNGALVNVTELNRLVGIPGNIVTLLASKENSLGNPGTSGYVLSSTTAGVRSWIAPGGGAVYPAGSGIPIVVAGASWGTTITDNSTDWNASYLAVQSAETGVMISQWNNGIEDNYLKALQAAGSSIKVGSAMGFYPRVDHTLYDGKALWTLFYLSDTTDVTGVGYMLSTQGNYTADNYNGFAIYSVSGTTYTKIDSTANDGNLWKISANTSAVKAFSAGPHELNPGIYYIFLVYNSSAQTTAPKLYYNNDLANAAFAGLTGTNKIQGVVNSQATPPATETGGDVTADAEIPAIWLY